MHVDQVKRETLAWLGGSHKEVLGRSGVFEASSQPLGAPGVRPARPPVCFCAGVERRRSVVAMMPGGAGLIREQAPVWAARTVPIRASNRTYNARGQAALHRPWVYELTNQ